MRYQAIYTNAAEAFGRNASLTAVQVLPSPLSGTRKVLDVVQKFDYPKHRRDREILSERRRDGGVSIFGEEVVTLLRSISTGSLL